MMLPTLLGHPLLKEWRRDSEGKVWIRYADQAGVQCWCKMDLLIDIYREEYWEAVRNYDSGNDEPFKRRRYLDR
jgi:hypothetical protein